MDDFQLANEVLELTLACQQHEPVPQEHERLQRLLETRPQAVVWYLRVAEDTLALYDAAATNEDGTKSPGRRLLPTGLGSIGPWCSTFLMMVARILRPRLLPRAVTAV